MAKIKALGIMNGTSIDAIDYTLIEVDTKTWKPRFLGHKQKPIPDKIRTQLLAAANDDMTVHQLSLLHFDLGRLYSKHIKAFSKQWSWKVIGLHGQTVHHQGKMATLQIGHPALIRSSWDGPVVSDFRSLDIAVGGEGAPFAPFFQKFLSLQAKKKSMAFHNLGGISNLTYFDSKKALAFDTGPANILMDLWIKKKTRNKKSYDQKGLQASKGLSHTPSLKRLMKHTFFYKKPPKSCGREEFNEPFIKKFAGKDFMKLSFEDQMATLAELSAVTIAKAYQKWCPKQPQEIFFYGGGVHNNYLMSRIQYHMPDCQLSRTEDLGWPTQALEAGAFAFLATARLFEKKIHLPQITGAKKSLCLGNLYC